ncbi:MAG: winged helix DNA-binding domain-containing protein [Chlorobi bacterium]|nr:winged helix DNA-binding domain-containing protein [Chlorobiota bacterium]MCI0716713.1 winged helix DNA-binding domain-containing protein [Chlorobiota bacterium]
MKAETISIQEARYLALHNQLLLDTHLHKTKKDLLKIIEQLGYVQIDTISVVERAHKHVLWTRFPSYKNEMLDELLDKDKKVFEFWDHAAAYMPMKHFKFTYRRKELYWNKYKAWRKKNLKLLNYILERIINEGPLQSRDFENPSKRGLWWDWKPAKEGLEYLFHSGKLAVRARKSFQKVYDLPERVLPNNIETKTPTEEEYSTHLIMKSIAANGFASEKEIIYLRNHDAKATKSALKYLAEDKKIIPLKINGIDNEIYYTTKNNLKQLETKKDDKHIHILSPFDNLVIQRKRLNTLFNFDYVIECYVPARKRKYGYFCLPILYSDRFIGRMDAKADRNNKVFKVINDFREDGINLNGKVKELFDKELKKIALFAGCEEISYLKAT